MARHWFFFSYARDNGHRLLNKFFNDLWGLLSGPLNGTEQDEKPFRDTASLRMGSKWLDGLREALEWSRTMIPMKVALRQRLILAAVNEAPRNGVRRKCL
jgi:hypothetical protein